MVEIVWAKIAVRSLQNVYEYLLEESFQNAHKVREDIFEAIDKLPKNSERYHLDQFKLDNPGNYRAFEMHNYRITYLHTTSQIKILRIRHVKQNPKTY